MTLASLNPFLAAAAEEAGHGAGHAVTTDPTGFAGTLAHWAWLIPVVPLVVMFLIVFFGKRMPKRGWELATGAMGFVVMARRDWRERGSHAPHEES